MIENQEKYLIKKSKAGNRAAFGKLVQKYHKMILYLAYDLIGNYEDAKDLAQDAFVKSFQKIDQFNEKSQFSTWLYRITVNIAMDFNRKNSTHSHYPLESEFDDENIDKKLVMLNLTEQPADLLEKDELKDQINSAVNYLSLQQRTAIVLKYFHEKPYDEISKIMDCSESTVRTHIFRAMENLKKILTEQRQ